MTGDTLFSTVWLKYDCAENITTWEITEETFSRNSEAIASEFTDMFTK